MIDYDRQMKTARIAPGDPRYDWKCEIFRALEFELPESGAVDLYDLSGITAPSPAVLAQAEAEAEMVLRDPVLAMRHWAFAESVRKFGQENSGGDLVNFRIFFNMPRSRGWSEEEFKTRILPQLCDLTEFLAARPARQVQINRVEGMNHAFAMITLEDNIVAEIECHDQLPDTLDPMRFIHAYYKHGAISNLPLAGFLNMEGLLLATADDVQHEVVENNSFEHFDEVDNFFFRTIWSLRNRREEAPILTTQSQWRDAIDAAWTTFNPVEVKQ